MRGAVFAFALLGSAALAAQTSSPSFEVASVKTNPSRTGIRGQDFPGDRYEAKNVPLRDLIMMAYGDAGQFLPEVQVVGGPDWLDTDRFDVSAKVERGSDTSIARKQLLLRALLVDRFKLVVHGESREQPIYALRLARNDGRLGARLRRANVDCEPVLASQPGRRERCILSIPATGAGSGRLMLRGQTMKAFANGLTMVLGRVVEDRTGLTGGFDADVDFSVPPSTEPPDINKSTAAFITALNEALGLRLEFARGPIQVLFIDHVERPTEN